MKAQVLLIGTILTPGKRVVTEALRVMGSYARLGWTAFVADGLTRRRP